MASRLIIALCGVVIAGLALEAFLRIALFSERFGIQRLRRPDLFAEFNADDDYWKLHLIWVGFSGFAPGRWHPILGEVSPRTPENPLGLLQPLGDSPPSDSPQPVVLFYGDSYLASPLADPSSRIPALLDASLSGMQVLNFGMGGHGLDQIALRFEMTYDRFQNPRVLIGVLLGDVDRCVLTVRQGQKPRFVMDESGELRLTNVPIDRDQLAYLRKNPPQVRSYLLRFARIALSRSALAKAIPSLRWDMRIAEKKSVGRALIERIASRCRERSTPLCFVIFYGEGALGWVSWQETFLRDTFQELGLCYIDTKPVLTKAVATGRISRELLFDKDSRHHSGLANRVIAETLVREWNRIDPRVESEPERARVENRQGGGYSDGFGVRDTP